MVAMILRRFVPDDTPALTDLVHQAYAELGRMGLNFTGVDQSEAVTQARALGGPTWLVVEGDELLASITMSWPAEYALARLTSEAAVPERAWLNQLAVHPKHRGRGLARALKDIGCAWCFEHGARSIGIDTAVPAQHLRTIYLAWGFKEKGTIQWPGKTYRSVVMTRDLLTPAAPMLERALATSPTTLTASDAVHHS